MIATCVRYISRSNHRNWCNERFITLSSLVCFPIAPIFVLTCSDGLIKCTQERARQPRQVCGTARYEKVNDERKWNKTNHEEAQFHNMAFCLASRRMAHVLLFSGKRHFHAAHWPQERSVCILCGDNTRRRCDERKTITELYDGTWTRWKNWFSK